MNRYFFLIGVLCATVSAAQPLRDINYEYLYNPGAPIDFRLRAVSDGETFTILYSLQGRSATVVPAEFSIVWEGRNSLNEKEGASITFNELQQVPGASGLDGRARMAVAGAPAYLVARVTHDPQRRAWLFYISLSAERPENNFLVRPDGSVVVKPYIAGSEQVVLAADSAQWIVSRYSNNFPPAAPAFSEAQARVAPVIRPDNIYNVRGGEAVRFPEDGLYLVQRDTSSLQGFAFRVENDYPQFSKLANLPGPLIYITTKQEYDRLAASHDNKKSFDRVILTMTTDQDRARVLMRSYFRRVEMANRYFMSYKEGWKSDRGMTLIVFGPPDEVVRFVDREVWGYKNQRFETSFTFSRSPSLFDPDNFVLIRDKKYEDLWYEIVDLWRNARF